MAKKSESSKRAQRQVEESAALKRVYLSFLVGLGVECYLFLLYRLFVLGTISATLFWAEWILPILTWLGIAALVGGAGMAACKKDRKWRMAGVITAAAGLIVSASSVLALKFFDVGLLTMCAAVAVATILALIFFLYQRDCFLNTTVLAGVLFVLWLCGRGLDNWKMVILGGVIAVSALLVVMCILAAKMRKNGGKLGKLQIFAADCNYYAIYGVSALAICIMLAAVLVPSVTFYLIWATVIVIFAELGYYTVKMM